VRNFGNYSKDPQTLNAIRRDLAQFIEWAAPRAGQ